MAEPVIDIRSLSKSFGGLKATDDVSLDLRPGEIHALIGPNGAGKTTLLEIICGRLEPDAGEVALAPAADIAYLDQHARDLPEDWTVLEVYREGQVEYEHNLISDLLRHGLFQLQDLDKRVRELSMGQRRKLQIARMIAGGHNLLVIDEPTNHLSLDVLEEFERALRAYPGPVIAVSHDRWFIERSGGKVWELRDHRLIEHHDEPRWVLAGLGQEAALSGD